MTWSARDGSASEGESSPTIHPPLSARERAPCLLLSGAGAACKPVTDRETLIDSSPGVI